MNYLIKVLLVSLVAGSPLSCGSSICLNGIISSGGSSYVPTSFVNSFSKFTEISSLQQSQQDKLSGILFRSVSSGVVDEYFIAKACIEYGIDFSIIESNIYDLVSYIANQDQRVKVIWSETKPSHQKINIGIKTQSVAKTNSVLELFKSKLVKYKGFSNISQELMNKISFLLFKKIESKEVVYADIVDLCKRNKFDISLINSGLFKFFQENYTTGIKFDLDTYYFNRIQSEGSIFIKRISNQFKELDVKLIQSIMAQYLNYTIQGKIDFNFVEYFKSNGIEIQNSNIQLLQNSIITESKNICYSVPDINIPSLAIGALQSSSGYDKSEMKTNAKFFTTFEREFQKTHFSTSSSYESFFESYRRKYSGCSVCLKEIDSCSNQAKFLYRSESSETVKGKIEASIKYKTEFNMETKTSMDASTESNEPSRLGKPIIPVKPNHTEKPSNPANPEKADIAKQPEKTKKINIQDPPELPGPGDNNCKDDTDGQVGTPVEDDIKSQNSISVKDDSNQIDIDMKGRNTDKTSLTVNDSNNNQNSSPVNKVIDNKDKIQLTDNIIIKDDTPVKEGSTNETENPIEPGGAGQVSIPVNDNQSSTPTKPVRIKKEIPHQEDANEVRTAIPVEDGIDSQDSTLIKSNSTSQDSIPLKDTNNIQDSSPGLQGSIDHNILTDQSDKIDPNSLPNKEVDKGQVILSEEDNNTIKDNIMVKQGSVRQDNLPVNDDNDQNNIHSKDVSEHQKLAPVEDDNANKYSTQTNDIDTNQENIPIIPSSSYKDNLSLKHTNEVQDSLRRNNDSIDQDSTIIKNRSGSQDGISTIVDALSKEGIVEERGFFDQRNLPLEVKDEVQMNHIINGSGDDSNSPAENAISIQPTTSVVETNTPQVIPSKIQGDVNQDSPSKRYKVNVGLKRHRDGREIYSSNESFYTNGLGRD